MNIELIKLDSKRTRNYFLIGLLFSLSGCFGVTKTFADKKYFLIEGDTVRAGEVKSAPKGSVLKIRRFSISQKFEGKEFVYRKDNVNYESDFYNSFFISPSSNLREELVKGLLSRKIFEWDAGQNTRLEPTHFIEGTVSELYGDFRSSPKAILSLDLLIYTENAGSPAIVFRKIYSRSLDIQTKEAGDLVSGWNQAMTQILTDIESDLKGKIETK